VLGPANLPAPIVSRLSSEITKVARQTDVRERLVLEGATVVGGTPQDAIAHIELEIVRWTKVVKAAGIKAN
jgi:tripartite-type tricarboxylate transporter receptor subunit TctC